jgi:hypothetical protein
MDTLIVHPSLVCTGFDCVSCKSPLLGPHYHFRMQEVMETAGGLAVESNRFDRMEVALCLCPVCAADIVNMVQSYIGA